ncbi:MAG: S8 family serine peptidase [Halolamina sp.]
MSRQNGREADGSLDRRSFLQATATAAAAALVGAGASGSAAAAGSFSDYRNYRAIEAEQGWTRGYRGRPDRTVSLTDSGIEARHPDLGPWNGVTAFVDDGELKLTKPAENTLSRDAIGGTSFSGTVGPGTFATGEETYHEFTTATDAEEIDATLSWSPNADASNDLEFRLDVWTGDRWETEARAATADEPEKLLSVPVDGDTKYRFAVEVYVNTTTSYDVDADFFAYSGQRVTYDDDVVFNDVGTDASAETPKTVGWYDASPRYGSYDRPRDPDGHGSHVASIMSGTGRASSYDTARSGVDEPRTVLSEVTGEYLSYEVEAEAGTGVFGAAYGELIELRIEGPDGQTRSASTVGIDDSSTNDVNTVQTPADVSGTYTVYVQTVDGESATSAYVETVAHGAFTDPATVDGDRDAGGPQTAHAGIAPDQSLVGLQGLSTPTEDLGRYAEQFTDTFNLRAVNMSWGYRGGLPLGAAAGTFDRTPSSIKDIADAGVLTVAAAGNAATPANGNGSPAVADEAVSVVATGPLDGISGYSSGGIGGVDEDDLDTYMKPDVTAPGGTVTDLVTAAQTGDPDASENEQAPIRDYTGKAGTSMASPFACGVTGLLAQAMEEDAPASVALPAPTRTTFDDVMRLKSVLLATASETVFTAAPYHRAKAPTYDFGGRDPYEGYGRVNLGAALDAVTRELSGTTEATVGLDVPFDERAVAGYVQAGPGTVEASVSFDHYSGGEKGSAEGRPHVDLFVYDAENPTENGEPNVVARAAGLQGEASTTVSLGRNAPEKTFLVVAKLVDVPGAVNGDDVAAALTLDVATESGFFADGDRTDDGDLFTGGQTNQVQLTVNPSEGSALRDVVPEEWSVLTSYSDDVARVEHDADRGVKYVHFATDAAADAETTVSYFAEAPAETALSQAYTFGPAEVDPGTGWVAVDGTADTNVVVAESTEL